jgi:hypothetical protein
MCVVSNLDILKSSLTSIWLNEIPRSKRTPILKVQGPTQKKKPISLLINKKIHKHIKAMQLENPKINLSSFDLNYLKLQT